MNILQECGIRNIIPKKRSMWEEYGIPDIQNNQEPTIKDIRIRWNHGLSITYTKKEFIQKIQNKKIMR